MPAHLGTCSNARPTETRGLVLTSHPMLMPSLISATSEGWELWGKKFTSLRGLFQLLTQQEKKNEFNLLSSLIFHYYKNKYTSAQRRETASSMHMSPGGVPPQVTTTTQPFPQSGGGGVDRP